MNQIDHKERSEKIIAWINNELDSEESTLFDSHVQSCPQCKRELKEYELLSRRLHALESKVEVPTLSPALLELKQEIAQVGVTTFPSQVAQSELQLADEEAELVERAKQGDSIALAKLYESYIDQIYRFIYNWVGNIYEAQTLTSETFTRAIEALSRGRYTWQDKRFGAWLYGIARTILLERQRKLKRGPIMEELDSVLGTHELSSQEPGALDILVQHEEQAAIWQLIKELAVEEQRILILRHVYGLSYADIAQALGRSENACKQLHYRVLKKLKLKVQETDLWTTAIQGKLRGERDLT